MFRDFSETAKQEFLQYVKDVAAIDVWDKVLDFLGDIFSMPGGWLAKLGVKGSVNKVGEYQKKVIDKYNMTSTQIEQIFSDVQAVDSRYAGMFGETITTANAIIQMLNSLCDTIDPNGGNLAMEAYRGLLEGDTEKLNNAKSTMAAAIEEGMFGVDVEGAEMSPDPVNLSTGNFVYDYADLTIGGEIPLSFHRYYNSRDTRSGALGKCFVHNYEISLKESASGDISVRLADGQQLYFEKTEDGYTGLGLAIDMLKKTDKGYSLIRMNQEKLLFDEDGRMSRKEDAKGRGITFTYDAKKRLTEARTDYGQSITYTYDEITGKLIRTEDHTGRVVELTYEKGLLTSVCTDGEIHEYRYGANGRLTEVVRPCGTVSVKNIYDKQYRVLEQEFADGSKMSFEYDDKNKRVTMLERNGSRTVYVHDEKYRNVETIYEDGTSEKYLYNERNQCILMTGRSGQTKRMAYDNRGNLVQMIDPLKRRVNMTYDAENRLLSLTLNGRTMLKNHYDRKGNLTGTENFFGNGYTVENDEAGRPLTRIYSDGSAEVLTYDERGNISSITNQLGGTTRYCYDALNRVSKVVDARGNESLFEYNAAGNIIKETNALGYFRAYAYNQNHQLTEVRNYDGSTEKRSYNDLGKPTAVTDAEGNTTRLDYDAMWNVSGVTLPNGAHTEYIYNRRNLLEEVKDALGSHVSFLYDADGNCIMETDEEGAETRFEYDAVGRLIAVVSAEGTKATYTYDMNDKLTGIVDDIGNEVTLIYDEMGRLLEEKSSLGEVRTYTYTVMDDVESVTDENGNTVKYSYMPGGEKLKEIIYPTGVTEAYDYDLNGNVTEKKDIFGNVFTYTYDELERLVKVEDSEGASKEFSYDVMDNVICIKDPLGNTTHYEYSVGGRLIKVIDALGNTEEYSYDANGNLTELIRKGTAEEENRKLTYERDLLGRISAVTDALGQKESYKYNARGELVEKIDKEGYLTRFAYTKLGDVSRVEYADGREVALSYNALRQLEQIKDWQGITRIENDNAGRATKVTYPDGESVSYTYGVSGNRTSLTYPDGKSIQYGYDEFLRLTSLKDGEHTVRYSYDELGRLSERLYPDGMKTNYTYTKLGLVESIVHSDREGLLDSYRYSYDRNGFKTGAVRERRGLAEESGVYDYGYDAMGRLTEVSRNEALLRCYTYDSFGNRVSMTENGRTTSYSYNVLDQLIRKSDGQNEELYGYDKRGNLSSIHANGKLKNSYRYGSLNRLEEAVSEKGTVSRYLYNGIGHRVGQTRRMNETLPEIRVKYVLDLTNQYNNLLQKEEDGISQSFLWDGKILGTTGNKEDYYFLHDEVGSPTRLFGTENRILETYGYDEFGRDLYKNDSLYHPFGFTGYQRDAISNTYYAQAREYLPMAGRFAARDVIKGIQYDPESQNEYLYCRNAPMDYVDPNGQFVVTATLIAIGIGAGVGAIASAGIDAACQGIKIAKGEQKKFKWGSLLGSAVEGAVVGGAAAIPGLGTAASIAVAAGAGAVGAGSKSAISQKIDDGKVDGSKVAEDAIIGGVISGVFAGIGKALGPVKDKIKTKIGITPKTSELSVAKKEVEKNIADLSKNELKMKAIEEAGKKASSLTRKTQAFLEDQSKQLLKKYAKELTKSKVKSLVQSSIYTLVGYKTIKTIVKDISKLLSPIYVAADEDNVLEYFTDYIKGYINLYGKVTGSCA